MLGQLKTRAALVAASLISLATPVIGSALPAHAAGGNNANAKACQQGGWKNWVQADGTQFENAGACVSYAAKGGSLTTPPPAPPEASQSELTCESYGGTFAVGSVNVLWTCTNLPALDVYAQFARFIDLGWHCTADGGGLYTSDFSVPESSTCSIE